MLRDFTTILLLLSVLYSYAVEIAVKQGNIVGIRQSTLIDGKVFHAFYGIPYAKPPVGKLRFKDPKPFKKWKKRLVATTQYNGACAQAHIVHKHAIFGSEDCLYMNIYTPEVFVKNDNLKNVLVWIHGYAFASSFSHVFGPDFFIENNIVVVTVTHRIGAFGFLKLNESDTNANMGLKDIVIALKWIQTNIKQFGGDKKKVTLMGNGSAATFISLLMMTKWRKLFSKIILHSGSVFSPSIFIGDHRKEKRELIKQLVKMGNSNWTSSSAKDIVEASQKMISNKELINIQRPYVPFTPIIEVKSNKSLVLYKPENWYNYYTSDVRIPVLIGYSSQESISEAIPFIHNPRYLKAFDEFFKFMVPFSNGCRYNYTSKSYKDISNQIKTKYFKKRVSENSLQEFLRYLSDMSIYPIYKFIKKQLELKETLLYVFKFNYVSEFNAVKATSIFNLKTPIKGAASGDELCYLFKCEPLWESYKKITKGINVKDKFIIKELALMWSNFIKTGNPNSGDVQNSSWLPMRDKEQNILLIDKTGDTKVIDAELEENMFTFWNQIYNNFFAKCQSDEHDEL